MRTWTCLGGGYYSASHKVSESSFLYKGNGPSPARLSPGIYFTCPDSSLGVPWAGLLVSSVSSGSLSFHSCCLHWNEWVWVSGLALRQGWLSRRCTAYLQYAWCVLGGALISLFIPQFPHHQNEDYNIQLIKLVWGVSHDPGPWEWCISS